MQIVRCWIGGCLQFSPYVLDNIIRLPSHLDSLIRWSRTYILAAPYSLILPAILIQYIGMISPRFRGEHALRRYPTGKQVHSQLLTYLRYV